MNKVKTDPCEKLCCMYFYYIKLSHFSDFCLGHTFGVNCNARTTCTNGSGVNLSFLAVQLVL